MNRIGSKHLVKEDRKIIEKALDEGLMCKDIAARIDKDERTVSREVKRWRIQKQNGKYGYNGKKDFCKTIERFPYVCNHCGKRQYCFAQFKYFYDADHAQKCYTELLSSSRTGLDVTLEEKIKFDAVLLNGIKKGQSVHHIMQAHRDELCYSERSAYRLIDQQKTVVQPIDLIRKVKLKPRKHYLPKEDNKAIREGRRYSDFIVRISQNPFIHVAELDTVEGQRDGQHKCLLTIHSTQTHFMVILVLPSKTKQCVTDALERLQSEWGIHNFRLFFNVSLTDRGCEFCNPAALEADAVTGEKICSLYFCNSYSSYQKGAIEENHELIRYIIPKGMAFDDLTQEQADLIASHINSYYRKSIETTPYRLAVRFYGEDFVKRTRVREIAPDSVTLKPSLLK